MHVWSGLWSSPDLFIFWRDTNDSKIIAESARMVRSGAAQPSDWGYVVKAMNVTTPLRLGHGLRLGHALRLSLGLRHRLRHTLRLRLSF